MKTSKSILSIIVFLFVFGVKASAYHIAVKNDDGVEIYYNYYNYGTELQVTYNSRDDDNRGYEGNVNIPETITYNGHTYNVTTIGNDAFRGCTRLTSVSIPNSVTTIGDDAFSNCTGLTKAEFASIESLCNIDFKNSYSNPLCYAKHLYINGEEVTEVVIPNCVTTIGKYAFYGYKGLTAISIPNSVTTIGTYAFYNCTNLNSVTIDSGVLSIESYAFNSPKPAKVIWLTNTPPSGYSNAAGKVNYVANDLYTSLNNKTVYPFLSSIFEVDGVKYVPVSPSERTCDAIDCTYSEKDEKINVGNTVNYKGILMTVKEVKPYTCYRNSFIKEVTISNQGNIGNNAFQNCKGIGSVNIYNQGNIGKSAFENCMGISSVNIYNQGNIGTSAFYGCKGNYTATINNKGLIGDSAFYNAEVVSLEVGTDVTDIGLSAFRGCTELVSANLQNQGNIKKDCFYGNSSLTTAILGEKINSIGSYAFYECSSLKAMTIPNAVTSIGSNGFQNCSSLESVQMGTGVKTIEEYTFSCCSALKDLQIGNNVNNIGTCAFSVCTDLSVITIPPSVTTISDYAFVRCSSLKNVFMIDREGAELILGSNGSSPLFASCPLDSVYIGRNITYKTTSSYGYSPFYRNTSLRSVEITNKETEISENEFYGCTNLKNVKIGDGVTSIGNWAFSGCSSLDYFSFGSAVKTIGKEAFSDCTAMTKLTSHATEPPVCDTQALDDINKWNCTLYIPAGTRTAYEAASQWKEFFFKEETTGIKTLTTDEATPYEYYSLKGEKLATPQPGVNIIRMKDGKTKKIMVK